MVDNKMYKMYLFKIYTSNCEREFITILAKDESEAVGTFLKVSRLPSSAEFELVDIGGAIVRHKQEW